MQANHAGCPPAGSHPGPPMLLVDDDEQLLAAAHRALGRDFWLLTAPNATQALELTRDHADLAVIIADLRMPGMDGIALLERVRGLAPDTVRMMLTGQADRDMVIQAINTGHIFRFLEKPCATATLERALRDGLEQHRRILATRALAVAQKQNETLEKVVVGFTRMVEARDPYTAGHQRRVAQLSVALGQILGLAPQRLADLRLAATIHDIGKIYVPAEFLNRPGRLSSLEMAIIKLHPQVGYDILEPLGLEHPLAQLVRQHHERLDGSGYPDGLAGDEILLEARVIAVADVVEAMANHRPYRPALGVERALAEIRAQRGVVFDPQVVDACLELMAVGCWNFPA